MSKAIMFQGTGSDVGKTVLVAGLCRLAANRGINVKPFKPQNMSNNAAVADDGGEIGRGQWLQAIAARQTPSIHMNPVLLKPQSDTGSQIVVQGQVWGEARAQDYRHLRERLLEAVIESYGQLRVSADLVLVEGAGSPAEINLRNGDIANMGFATKADVPVILIGDIHRGGVIASLVGTHKILPEKDRNMIVGFLVNKFRGDVSLFDEGVQAINDFTGWPSMGVIPWLRSARKLPEEDSVALERAVDGAGDSLTIAIPRLPRIANFDDFDPLIAEPDVDVQFIEPGDKIPSHAALVILPGSKSTISDLQYLFREGWQEMLRDHIARGGYVMGICGGYQMLGKRVSDPDGVEGNIANFVGFGLLDIETIITSRKITENVHAQSEIFDVPLAGYEIHMGRTEGPDCSRPFAHINGEPDGAMRTDGRVIGTYLHGLFSSDDFRAKFLEQLGVKASNMDYAKSVDQALNEIADTLDQVVDFDEILSLAR